MYKLILLFITLNFFIKDSYAQEITSDTTYGKIVYRRKVKSQVSFRPGLPPSVIKLAKPITSNEILYFGNYKSLYKFAQIGMDKKQRGLQFQTQKGSMSFSPSTVDDKGYRFYRNFKTKELIIRQIKSGPKPAYTYKDNWVPIPWKIFDEHKEILGYKVQKAQGYFRGRKYTVWFTKEIPFSYGPWKLFGLPGVILQSKPDNIGILRTAIKICYPCESQKKNLKKPQEKINRTIQEHVYLNDHFREEMAFFFNKLIDHKNVIYDDQKTTLKGIQRRRQYLPEIIYEWEKFPGDTPKPKWFNVTLESEYQKKQREEKLKMEQDR